MVLSVAHRKIALGSILLLQAGCMNSPTAPSEIPIPHVSTAPYENLDCIRLTDELLRLRNAEFELAAAQDRRISSSGGHALFYGWGQGDGMETVELARVRGERDAVRRTHAMKACIGG